MGRAKQRRPLKPFPKLRIVETLNQSAAKKIFSQRELPTPRAVDGRAVQPRAPSRQRLPRRLRQSRYKIAHQRFEQGQQLRVVRGGGFEPALVQAAQRPQGDLEGRSLTPRPKQGGHQLVLSLRQKKTQSAARLGKGVEKLKIDLPPTVAEQFYRHKKTPTRSVLG
jgi:hypothetical protein